MAKKAHVNESCIGCGACTAVCPSVFELGDAGTAENVLGEDTEIPEDLVAEVEEAAASCPVEAIEVTE